jgi:hypothetical protein
MRDVADDDFVGWIDGQLDGANSQSPDRLAALREAIVGPMRNLYGVADKVLAMALSFLLLAAGKRRPLWLEAGATFVAIDTLVHNFLHRTGILRCLSADHLYGLGCYRPGGCADILGLLAAQIDTRQFNPTFPKTFPRFVQSAIWRYCAADGRDICNGNRIDDAPIATIGIVRCSDAAIASLYEPKRRKSLYFSDLSALLTTTIGCNTMIMQLIV